MKNTKRRAAGVLIATAAVVTPVVMAAPAQAASRPTVIAHRGDMTAAPESTNAAFRKAVQKGADAIEIDVRFSSGRYPVILHDMTLNRTTNCSGSVSNKTREQLARCDAGSWFSSAYRGERIPTLDSALKTISSASSRTRVLLHVKEYPSGVKGERIMNAVKRWGMRSRIIIIADTNSILTRMRAVGFTELGRVFGSASDWDLKYEYMIPFKIRLDRSATAAIHRRGGKVWPVEGGSTSLRDLLESPLGDGVLVNRLTAALNML